MTVPIIPGPFAFLAGAGQALGRYGQAVSDEEQKRRDDAAKSLNSIVQLIANGMDPSVLNSPHTMDLLRTLGVPTETPATRGTPAVAPDVRPGFDPGALGVDPANPPSEMLVPGTGAAAIPGQPLFHKTPDQIMAAIRTRFLANVQPGSAQERAIVQIPSESVARAGERTIVAGAGTAEHQATITGAQAGVAGPLAAAQLTTASAQAAAAPSTAQAAIAQNAMTQSVFEGATRLLGTNPAMAQLAQEAALGILPMRVAQLESNRMNLTLARQAQSDEARLLLAALDDVSTTHNQLVRQWQTGLEQAVQRASVQETDTNNPEQMAAVRAAYIATAGDAPTFDQVRDSYLRTNLGINAQQFQDALTSLLPIITGNRQHGPGRQPLGGGNAGDKIHRIIETLRANPTAAAVDDLIGRMRLGAVTLTELRSVRARATTLPEGVLNRLDQQIMALAGQTGPAAR